MTLYESIAAQDYPLFERLLREGHDVNEVYVYHGETSLIPVYPSEEGTRSTPVVMAAIVYASLGDDRFLPRLVDAGADVNAPDPDGETPLEAVVGRGSFEAIAIRTLAELGADVHHTNRQGQTALDRAVLDRAALSAVALIELGADASRYSDNLSTRRWLDVVAPAEYAVEQGDYERLRKALESGLRLDEGSDEGFLALAARNSYPDLVHLLLKWGADPNLVRRIYDHTPLIMAVAGGSLEIVQTLIAAGADVNPPGRRSTPIEYAVTGRDRDLAVMRTLLEAGAVPDADALAEAIRWGNAEALRELLRAGANVNEKDFALLLGAVRATLSGPERAQIMRVLLDAGADVNVMPSDGTTPLMMACARCDIETVSLLLERGADHRRRNDRGYDWVDFARRNEDRRVLAFVLRRHQEEKRKPE